MGFGNLMLKSKVLSIGFIRVILIMLLAAIGMVAVTSLRHDFDGMDRAHQRARCTVQIEASAANLNASVDRLAETGDQAFLDLFKRHQKALDEEMARLKGWLSSDPVRTRLLAEIRTAFNDWKTQTIAPMMQAIQRGGQEAGKDKPAALDTRTRETARFGRLMQALTAFRANEETSLKEQRADGDQIAWYALILLAAGGIVTSVVSVSISSLVIDAITKPVGKAAALAEAITSGDLSGHVGLKGKDEIARLGKALDHMTENLRNQTLQTLEAVNVLSSAATEITSTASQLSEGASRTSSALTETTTTVEEVKRAAKVSSEQAKSVAEISRQAVEVSQAGLKATTETIQKMEQIKEQMQSIGETVVRLSNHSRAIENIIGSVQDIAEQSNLLAVNASIEAARAGDQGKGFAVVAVEIKQLADQSKAATDQVRGILEDTKKWVSTLVMATEQGIKAVDAGVEQSSVAGESIDALSRTVDSSAHSAALIDASAGQQFVGVERVASAVSSMEQALSQHLTGTSELEAAAKRLEVLGGALSNLVQRYRI